MRFGTKIVMMLPVLVTMLLALMVKEVNGEPQAPCYFVFGDSLVDNGNNNVLRTTAKANYPPYGIDFPQGPTGRFCNGPNIADIIAQLLGFDRFIQPFTNLTNRDILLGVNYGSGGAGILDESGKNLGQRFSMKDQLEYHKSTLLRFSLFFGSIESAKNYSSKCIYTVGMGNNDYINNYLQPDYYPSSKIYTPVQFADLLIHKYTEQLTKLYGYGARKVAVFGLGLTGCTPAEVAINGPDASGCVDRINNYTRLFDNRLQPLVDGLNRNLSGAMFTFINITQISATPSGGGLNFAQPCCVTNSNTGLCVPNSVPCPTRDNNGFFDSFHPSTVTNRYLGERSYNASANPTDAQPFDISTLARL